MRALVKNMNESRHWKQSPLLAVRKRRLSLFKNHLNLSIIPTFDPQNPWKESSAWWIPCMAGARSPP
jgi:hypothetical protein